MNNQKWLRPEPTVWTVKLYMVGTTLNVWRYGLGAEQRAWTAGAIPLGTWYIGSYTVYVPCTRVRTSLTNPRNSNIIYSLF